MVNNELTSKFINGLDMKNLAVQAHEGIRIWPLPSVSIAKNANAFELRPHETADRVATDFIVLSKYQSGFSLEQIADFRETIDAAQQGAFGPVRYIVLDLVGNAPSATVNDRTFLELAGAVETLVRSSPIISVACARGQIAGADLELALAANVLVADAKATFSFAAEPTSALGLYGCLAKKLGFVQAERLMDQAQILSTEQMCELFLVKETLDLNENMDALWRFLERSGRRHNASHAIYRAQSIASPSIYRSLTMDV